MKVGDTVPVNIGQGVVAQAKIVELGDGTATLIIPATKVVMGVTTQLDTTPAAPSGPEHAILGVETPTVEAPSAAESATLDAPVVETPVIETAPAQTPALPADGVVPPAEGATAPVESVSDGNVESKPE